MVVYENKNKDAVSAGTLYFVMSIWGQRLLSCHFLFLLHIPIVLNFYRFTIGDILPPGN